MMAMHLKMRVWTHIKTTGVVSGANSRCIIMDDLVGKSYVFEDGNRIDLAQIKKRDGNRYWVTYQIQQDTVV